MRRDAATTAQVTIEDDLAASARQALAFDTANTLRRYEHDRTHT